MRYRAFISHNLRDFDLQKIIQDAQSFGIEVYVYKHDFQPGQPIVSEEQARSFRLNRLLTVRSLEFLPNLEVSGSYFLHIIPISCTKKIIDLVEEEDKIRLKPIGVSGWDSRFNLDGYITFGGPRNKVASYNQCFRNGAIEIYTTRIHKQSNEDPKIFNIDGGIFERRSVEYIKKSFKVLNLLGVDPPVATFISIYDLHQGRIVNYPRNLPSDYNQFDRNEILFPGVIVEDFSKDVPTAMHSIFDMFWQSAGWPRSPFFDNEGKWRLKIVENN